MDDSVFNQLQETNWRRKLTRDEEAELRAWLAAHPGAEFDWETEAALNECLGGLPQAAVSSNFAARVLQAVAADSANVRPRSPRRWNWRSLVPRAAVAGIAVVVLAGTYWRHEANQRVELARRVANVSDMAALSSPEVLQDFETVRHLNQTPAADEELLALLQ
jgi:hypothetical protein